MSTSAQKALSAAADAILAAGKTPAPAPVATATPATPATPAKVGKGKLASATATPATPATAPATATQHKATPSSGPAFKLGKMPPVAVNSHRGYAQAVALHVAQVGGGTFTLGALRAAFVANPLPEGHPCKNVAPPKGGWAKHNMPTWAAGQGWWVAA